MPAFFAVRACERTLRTPPVIPTLAFFFAVLARERTHAQARPSRSPSCAGCSARASAASCARGFLVKAAGLCDNECASGDWRSGSAGPLQGQGRGFKSLIAHHPRTSRSAAKRIRPAFLFHATLSAARSVPRDCHQTENLAWLPAMRKPISHGPRYGKTHFLRSAPLEDSFLMICAMLWLRLREMSHRAFDVPAFVSSFALLF